MTDTKQNSDFKVLVAEPEGTLTRQLVDFLKEKNLKVELCREGKDLKDQFDNFKPDFVVIDLLFVGCTAFQLLDHMRLTKTLKDCKVIVTSKHNSMSNVRAVIGAGASDYVIKPYNMDDMIGRMAFQIQKKKKYDAAKRKDDNGQASYYFNYVDLMLRELAANKEIHPRAFNLTRMLAMTVKAVRISVIHCQEDRQKGIVRASSDDGKLNGLEINIARYPEVQYVLNTEKIVVLENLSKDPMMSQIKSLVKSVSFNSMIVAPIFKHGKIYGVLSTRFDEDQTNIADSQVRFCDMVANMMSMLVSTEDSFEIYDPNADEEEGLSPEKNSDSEAA
ncbi:MAG: response regulator [Bdellovibrionota bacterium]